MNMEKSRQNTITVIEFSEEGSVKQEIRDEEIETIEETEEIEDIPIEEIPMKTLETNQLPKGNTTKSGPRVNVAMPSGVNVVIINGIKIVKSRDDRLVSRPVTGRSLGMSPD